MSVKRENQMQVRFFERIKEIIPHSLSLVNEIADVLEVSNDSAYRRMRGETPLTIDELSILCSHFKIGFDIFNNQSGSVSFNFEHMDGIDGFRNYLLEIINTLTLLSNSKSAELFYAATDIPIFHHFKYPELAAFKIFYWLKDVLNVPIYDNAKFSPYEVSDDLKLLGQKIYEEYRKVVSTEIWTTDTVNSTIAQIEFYWSSGIIPDKELAITLCNQFEEELRNIQKQAEIGHKLILEEPNDINNFKLYFSEIEIGNNCILTKVGEMKTVYLSFHTFNKLATRNIKLCEDTMRWLNNLIRKSTLISGVSEKQRYLFFKNVYEKVAKLKTKIENQDE
jgi:hypothetical protein